MNAVNNGPAGSPVRKTGNTEAYAALEIPYARNHDASFYSVYGGEHTVDVHRIFKNFDAEKFSCLVDMKLFDTYLIKITAL